MTPPEGHPRTNGKHADRVHIFDTTLRDGEQSPGISLNVQEKLEIAHQLARLGVDVIEAGFPITSPGDFKAVDGDRQGVEGPVICGLARTSRRTSTPPGTPSSTPSVRGSTPSSRPPTSTSSASCRPRARTSSARPARPSRTPSSTATTSSSRPRTAAAPTSSSWPRWSRPRSKRAPPRSTSRTRSATRCRTSTRRCSRELYRLVPELRDVVVSGALPRRPGLAVANSFAG